jgi:hypothetical protein
MTARIRAHDCETSEDSSPVDQSRNFSLMRGETVVEVGVDSDSVDQDPEPVSENERKTISQYEGHRVIGRRGVELTLPFPNQR